MRNTETVFNEILQSEVFRLDGPTIDICESLSELARAINAEEETDWDLGECLECSLDSLVIGAYWALSEWIADGCFGGSPANEPYFLLGTIFTPGMAEGPEPESGEEIAYDLINEHLGRVLSNV